MQYVAYAIHPFYIFFPIPKHWSIKRYGIPFIKPFSKWNSLFAVDIRSKQSVLVSSMVYYLWKRYLLRKDYFSSFGSSLKMQGFSCIEILFLYLGLQLEFLLLATSLHTFGSSSSSILFLFLSYIFLFCFHLLYLTSLRFLPIFDSEFTSFSNILLAIVAKTSFSAAGWLVACKCSFSLVFSFRFTWISSIIWLDTQPNFPNISYLYIHFLKTLIFFPISCSKFFLLIW